MTAHEALFESRSSLFFPTPAARGPWDERSLHGGAVAALFAGRMAVPGCTMARLTIDLLAPVPCLPLSLQVGQPVGGRRAVRREAVLTRDGRVVAIGRSLHVRCADLELPPQVLDHVSPFDPTQAPALCAPRREIADMIGWESFDSAALVTERLAVPDDPDSTYLWVGLTIPVVAGEKLAGVEVASAAADYAQTAAGRQLPFDHWRFLNAELTLHLTRAPNPDWIGLRCECLAQPVGTGLSSAVLYDGAGRIGQSAQALVLEERALPRR